jgi:hypothetical protein
MNFSTSFLLVYFKVLTLRICLPQTELKLLKLILWPFKVAIFGYFRANFSTTILMPCDVTSVTHCQHGVSMHEGVSMHLFPNEETDAQRRNKCVKFVCKHNPGFDTTATLCLHFEDSCYDLNLELAKSQI